MSLGNTKSSYGWIAIGLHWISAAGVIALYFLGERMEDAASRAEKLAAQQVHVSVAMLLFIFLAARIAWSATQPSPSPLEPNRALQIIAKAVQGLFMLMILVLLVTGPLAIWSTTRPIEIFNLMSIPSPFPVRNQGLHELMETVHGAATKLFWPLLVPHVGGALKHVIVDRDGVMLRMLRPQRS